MNIWGILPPFDPLKRESERETPEETASCRIMSSLEVEETVAPPRRKLSCTAYFDALWFCYSPVHQLQNYYRLGSLDNCSQKWSVLYDCLKLKTKRATEAEAILEDREKSNPHIWSNRSPEEAAAHWEELFGHLDEAE